MANKLTKLISHFLIVGLDNRFLLGFAFDYVLILQG